MFTGLIEHVGRVRSVVSSAGNGSRIAVDLGPLAEGTRPGDSVAIDGCCLTVTSLAGSLAVFDAVPETMARTTMGEREAGDPVNLERALLPGARLGGHFVQGHVDVTATVKRTVRGGHWAEWHFALDDPGPGAQIVEKGSIAIDGISLTVAGCDGNGGFWVALIPETLRRSALGAKSEGRRVNIETDILGKYVQAMLARRLAPPSQGADGEMGEPSVITEEWLRERGFE